MNGYVRCLRGMAVLVIFLNSTSYAFSAGARNVTVVCDRWPESASMEGFARDAVRIMEARDEDEKALAVFRFVRMFSSVTDGNVPREPALQDTYIDDPLKVLNVYGAHHCDGLSRIMEAAWRSLGYRAEKLYRSGHTQAHIWYEDNDGVCRWHLFDVSQGWFVYDRSGSHIASADEIAADYSLIFIPSKGPIPSKPHYWGMSNWIHAPHVRWGEYSSGIQLDRNEAITFLWGNIGLPYQDNFKKKGKKNIEHGPYPVTYGNGMHVWKPDLSLLGSEKFDRCSVSNITCVREAGKNTALSPKEPGAVAEITYEVKLPYIIADAWIGGSVEKAHNTDVCVIAISCDNGKTWKDVWENIATGETTFKKVPMREKVDARADSSDRSITPFGRYGYCIKITMQSHGKNTDVRLNDLSITTVFQHNIFALPQLWPGENAISIKGEMSEEVGLKATYQWDDASGKKYDDVAFSDRLPFQYTIFAKGKTWEDVRCTSLMLEVVPKTTKQRRTANHEKSNNQSTTFSPEQVFSLDRIVGTGMPVNSKPPDAYRDILQRHGIGKPSINALARLMALKDKQSFQVILETAENTVRFPQKDMAVQALALIDVKKATPFFISIWNKDKQIALKQDSTNMDVELGHWYMLCALTGHIVSLKEDRCAVPYLMRVLDSVIEHNDTSWETHASIIRSLGRIGDTSAAPSIRPFMDRNIDESCMAVWALGELKDHQSIPRIRALFKKTDYPILRHHAAEALGKLGDTSIAPDLVKMLDDDDENARACAAEALGRIGSLDAVPRLENLIQREKFSWVREIAEESLKNINKPENSIRDGI